MSVSKLPSGRWRAQVHDPALHRNVSVSTVLGGPGTFATKTEAKQARSAAREKLAEGRDTGPTVKQFWKTWTTDPLYARPKESTNLHNAERTKAFAEKHATMPLANVSDLTVAEWIRGGRNLGTIPGLRAMFNDAMSAKAGRLVTRNPFAKLGLARGRGRRDQTPPLEQTVRELVAHAARLTGPSFAAWLQVAAYTGMRPGELDALRWTSVNLDTERISVLEQWNARSRRFTLPKNGRTRLAPLTAPARAALLGLPRESEFCFVNLRGKHFTASSRAYHWNAIKAAAGYDASLYLATRHFAGSFMINTLQMASEDVAIALGHEDGGQLVRQLYGHRDRAAALDRVVAAYKPATVTPLRAVREEAS